MTGSQHVYKTGSQIVVIKGVARPNLSLGTICPSRNLLKLSLQSISAVCGWRNLVGTPEGCTIWSAYRLQQIVSSLMNKVVYKVLYEKCLDLLLYYLIVQISV